MCEETFDVITCDLFNPVREGTASMYSADFFKEALLQLNQDGVFCLWLPSYQLNRDTAGIIVSTFISVFPNAIMVRGNLDPLQPTIGLLGSKEAFNRQAKWTYDS